MQKIIIDTNVFVSAIIQRGFSHYIVAELFSTSNIELCVSFELFKEYYDVLNRGRFAKYPDFVSKSKVLLAGIEKKAMKYFPTVRLDIISDRDDNKLLELAETCRAQYLITGNTKDFTMPIYKGTKIVTPKEYWTKHIFL